MFRVIIGVSSSIPGRAPARRPTRRRRNSLGRIGQSVRLPVAEPRHKARGVSLLAAFRRPGILLLLPLLLALAARMLVAPGWMIASDAGGSITVRICSDPDNPGGTMTSPLEKAEIGRASGRERGGESGEVSG